jgi:hypothetical protein
VRDVLRQLWAAKVRIVPRGRGLVFRYSTTLAPDALAELRGYETDVMDLYGERAAIRQYDGGMARDEAEAAAVLDLVAMGARYVGWCPLEERHTCGG